MAKKKSFDEVFEEMAQKLIEDMERVDCAPRDYLEGLKIAQEMLRDRYQMYRAEVEAREEREDDG